MAAAGVVHHDVAGVEVGEDALIGEAQVTGDHVVQLLTLVVGEVDLIFLRLLGVRDGDDEGLRELLGEQGRLVQVLKAGTTLDRDTLAVADQREALEVRRLARQQLGHVHAQLVGALVDKGKGQVSLAGLLRGVLGHTASRGVRHLLHGQIEVLA